MIEKLAAFTTARVWDLTAIGVVLILGAILVVDQVERWAAWRALRRGWASREKIEPNVRERNRAR